MCSKPLMNDMKQDASLHNAAVSYWTTSLWRGFNNVYFAGDSCSGMSQTLDEGCTISDDCSTITCKMNFVEKPITFKLKVSTVIFFYKYPHNMLKVRKKRATKNTQLVLQYCCKLSWIAMLRLFTTHLKTCLVTNQVVNRFERGW